MVSDAKASILTQRLTRQTGEHAANVSTTHANDEAKEEHASEPAKVNEDLAGWGIWCNGDCNKKIDKWSEPFYLCLICPNTDLCVGCHEKRLESDKGEGKGSWKRFCAPDHRYIKGPMKGWQGVRDGVIRIEGEEPIGVKEWVKGLKEDRWPRAWERYWLKQGGLKDIDVL